MVTTQEAAKRVEALRVGLAVACKAVTVTTRKTMFPTLTNMVGNRLCDKLVKAGYLSLELQGANGVPSYYRPDRARLETLLNDQDALVDFLWPPHTIPEPAADDNDNSSAALPPPPTLVGVMQPPPGASNDVLLAWIFTLLHAQVENMVYLRTQVDEMRIILNKYL